MFDDKKVINESLECHNGGNVRDVDLISKVRVISLPSYRN